MALLAPPRVTGTLEHSEPQEELFASTGLPNQEVVLPSAQFLDGSALVTAEPALFDDGPESVEDFEEGWSQNETFIDELTSAAAADYDPGAANNPLEDFEGLWAGNSGYLFAFAPVDLSAMPTEAFESGWRSNGTFVFAFAPANLSTPLVENFEGTWPTVMKTV